MYVLDGAVDMLGALLLGGPEKAMSEYNNLDLLKSI